MNNPPPPPASTTTVAGSVTVSIAGHTYTLTGTLGNSVIVEYHAAFEDAISLGSIDQIATTIGDDLHFPGLGQEITSARDQLKTMQLPVVGDLVKALTSASIRITDLEINTQTKAYGIGVALDFTQLPPGTAAPELFGITLLSLGFKVTKVNTAATP
jgi:hypothetical protein